eukprot:180600_1
MSIQSNISRQNNTHYHPSPYHSTLRDIFFPHLHIISIYFIKDVLSTNTISNYYRQTQGVSCNNLEKHTMIHIATGLGIQYQTMHCLLSVPLAKLSTDIAALSFHYFQSDPTLLSFYHSSLNSLYMDTLVHIIHFFIALSMPPAKPLPIKRKRKKPLKPQVAKLKPPKPIHFTETMEFEQSIVDKYIQIKRIDTELLYQWNSISEKQYQAFDSIRDPMNCISNYMIRQQNINSEVQTMDQISIPNLKYLQIMDKYDPNQTAHGMQKTYKQQIKTIRNDWITDSRTHSSSSVVLLHHVKRVGLICPRCLCFVQSISQSEDCIALICYNYPKCQYPLDTEDYQSKYVWHKVEYVGPLVQDLFSMVGMDEKEKQIWQIDQDRKWKTLRRKMKYKKKAMDDRNQAMNNTQNKEWHQVAKARFETSKRRIMEIQKHHKVFLREIKFKSCKLEMLFCKSKMNRDQSINLMKEVILEHMLSDPICVDKQLFD